MTDYPLNHYLTAGFPGTGKTTFLAALWHVLESSELQTGLRLKSVQGDRQYLNQIREKWISCSPLDRTSQGTEELQISLLLEFADGSTTVKMVIPDMSGESYSNLWEVREWEQKYDDVARLAKGILFFIHPNKVKPRMRIRDICVPSDKPEEEVEMEQTPSEKSSAPWVPSQSPTEVQLVELLQFFTHDTHYYPLDRVAFIISAWDLVEEQGLPTEWLARRMPLLDQFLRSNSNRLKHRIYGLSAQNGDISNQETADKLRGYTKPSERILIIGDECNSNDITAPLKWLMEL